MTPPDRTLLIAGVGLLGASTALAARRAGVVSTILGHDVSDTSLAGATQIGAIDEAVTLEHGLPRADIVVIATPPEAVIPLVRAALELGRPEALIMDLSSVKERQLAELDEIIPIDRLYLSVHPMAGGTSSGPSDARADLFDGRGAILVPSVCTRPEAMEQGQAFWQAIGATVLQALPHEHDQLLAGLSHLPQMISTCLGLALAELYPNARDVRGYGGPAVRDMLRVARSNPELWAQITTRNAENIEVALEAFSRQLEILRDAVRAAGSGDVGALRAAVAAGGDASRALSVEERGGGGG